MDQIISPEIFQFILPPKAEFPNNPSLPLLLYKQVLLPFEKHPDRKVKKIFKKNEWKNSWTDGIYDYHHYHSTVHEVLGICKGEAHIIVGGPDGTKIHLQEGDVLIIPAGVAHKCLSASKDFSCVGAYPDGMDYDMKHGGLDEITYALPEITKVPLPENDPVFGSDGPLKNYWKESQSAKSAGRT
ncbi:MAG TPA: cupin domain-containing protein [Chitinophagales bacterium]|nr:cupin domain-containing protein [Chitinophagales bacterium]